MPQPDLADMRQWLAACAAARANPRAQEHFEAAWKNL
jgi:hypothetical protein